MDSGEQRMASSNYIPTSRYISPETLLTEDSIVKRKEVFPDPSWPQSDHYYYFFQVTDHSLHTTYMSILDCKSLAHASARANGVLIGSRLK